MYYAVSHQTAAEIIYNRADSEKEHMGLISWKHSPNGKISMEIAKDKAITEFGKYRIKQDKFYQSDFDKLLESSKEE